MNCYPQAHSSAWTTSPTTTQRPPPSPATGFISFQTAFLRISNATFPPKIPPVTVKSWPTSSEAARSSQGSARLDDDLPSWNLNSGPIACNQNPPKLLHKRCCVRSTGWHEEPESLYSDFSQKLIDNLDSLVGLVNVVDPQLVGDFA